MTDNIRNSFIDDLLGLISIQSVNGDSHGIKRCFDYIKSIADRFGFCSRVCAQGMVLEVYPHNVPIVPKIGIITHVDTVPFDETKWTHNPLGEYVDGRIYGRGVLDDKVGVIYSLYAFKELEEYIKPDWKIIIGSCEEGVWSDMKAYLGEGNTPPGFVITIDGDGIQNGCRGTLNIEMVFNCKSDHPYIKDFQTPNGVSNIVPDTVLIQLDDFVDEIKGKAAHSSAPENGINAISVAYNKHMEVIANDFPDFAIFMDNYMSKPNALFIEEGGRIIRGQKDPGTIATPTMIKMKDGKLYVRVNVRLSPSIMSKQGFYFSLAKARETYDCMILVKEMVLPAFIHKDNEELIKMQDAYEEVMGHRAEVKIALGTGYNATFPNAAIFGPRFDDDDEKEEDLCHCPDESRSLDDIEKFYKILCGYIRRSLGR